jgi:hypothetical protein
MCRIVRVFEMFLTLTIAAACISPSPAQTIHICCNLEDCAKRQVKPNLQLIATTHLFGSLVDQTGRPFRLSKVELRKWVSPTRQVLLKTVNTDKDGNFDMGLVEIGQYRFLPSDTGAFQQPEYLPCPQSECRLELELRVSATDTPEAICPIR